MMEERERRMIGGGPRWNPCVVLLPLFAFAPLLQQRKQELVEEIHIVSSVDSVCTS